MSDRFKKDSTPPPLLLMPAGGGLTLNPPEQPNVLMPVVQSAAPSLLDPEMEAEADSFVGQTPPSHKQPLSSSNDLPSTYFQSQSMRGSDPFAQVGPAQFQTGPPPTSFPPQPPPMVSQAAPNIGPPSSLGPPQPLPPSIAAAQAGGGRNIYRQQGGRPQYAPPLSGPPPVSQPPTPQQPAFSSPMPPTMMGGSNNSSVPVAHETVQAGQGSSEQYTGGLYYQPLRHNWCYQESQGDLEVWRPFSVIDSTQLELAFNIRLNESPQDTIVITNGGRYEVNVGCRVRKSVFWDQEPASVRRCSWFFKREGDNRYIPYDEDFCFKLENEYKKALETNGWHRRLEFPGKEIIVMHNASVILQFPASSTLDEWGNVLGDQMRPRVVKRGVDDFATIEYGEREEVDHLVFFVPGVEEMTDGKLKSLEEYVDDFRSNSHSLLQSHFTSAFQSKTVNRVEFLPVLWTKALKDDTSDIHQLVSSITLPSTTKLRNFVNSTMVDTLFYNSPSYCQKICETVGNEMNRMFQIFLEKHESFSGDVSLAGHSLGATILFDLLLHQRMPGEAAPPPPPPSNNEVNANQSVQQESAIDSSFKEEESGQESTELTLEAILAKVGLSDKVSLFHQEQIDMESLIMCSEQDLKDIGLPMGPRKKLLGLLKEEKEKKDERAKNDMMKKMRDEMEKMKLEASQSAVAVLNTSTNNVNASPAQGKETSVDYLTGGIGVGQLKVCYPQLDFTPSALFAMGSPIALYLSLRGIDEVGEFFQLPTCPRVFNIFHPFDPMAFRLEPLIRPSMSQVKPVQVAHYKGRKRLHLEFKEAVSRYGTDLKHKLMESLKSTWNSINDFAKAHRSDAKPNMDNQVQSEMDQMMKQISQQHADDDIASVSSMAEEEIHIGQLNEGLRVDYQLQEGPLESFNDYLFALTSHSCYWDSEDTALLVLKEIYSPLGVRPVMPGKNGRHVPPPPMSAMTPPRPHPPPPSSYPPPQSAASVYSSQSQATFAPAPFQNTSTAAPSAGPPPPMFNPQTSQSPFTQSSPGVRKSHYVPPDFHNLPQAPPIMAGQNPGPPPMGPPPMGPAAPSGYRRTGPM